MPEQDADKTALTTAQDDAEPRDDAADGGTPESGERDADGKGTDYKALHLANKETIAELKAQVSDLKERADAGTQPAPGRETQLQSEIDAEESEIAELRRLAPVDPAARAALRQKQDIQNLRRDTMDALSLARVPEEKQEAVLKYYEKNRSHFDSLAACLRYIRGREAETKAATLEKKVEELERKLKGEDKDNDVVRQGGRDLPATKGKAIQTTKEQFDKEQRDLRNEGRFKEARDRQGMLRRGELVLRG